MNRDDLPPYISTGDAGSFARKTLQNRKPAIIDKVLRANDFTGKQRDALLNLKEDLLHGVIADPFEISPFEFSAMEPGSVHMWREEVSRYRGRSWLNAPFYFAEALLYMRIILDIGYFDSRSSYYLKDPYAGFKESELFSRNGGLEIGRTLVQTIDQIKDPSRKIITILFNSLWGNRVDLSLFSIAECSRGRVLTEGEENLLIDHSAELGKLIKNSKRIDFILDNTGQELVSDLITAWYLLSSAPHREVHLHAKKYPFYVSDAMKGDIDRTFGAFVDDPNEKLSRIGRDLQSLLRTNKLLFHDHFFWNGPLHYVDLPVEIERDLSRSDVVLLKGDINYRRVVSDRKWKTSDNLEDIASYFPASFGLLRTMKSECVVDIDAEVAADLFREDPEWMVNGERGIIRVVKKP
jgi:hypothetical protein